MGKTWKRLLLVTAFSAIGGLAANADEQREQNLKSGELTTVELLQLMDKDKDGKVSRQEFMDFMSAEFDRLDVNKDGKLDLNELQQLLHRVGRGSGYPGAR